MFARRGESLSIERRDPGALNVFVTGDAGLQRSYIFATEEELSDFLARLEEHLLEAGWTFQRFESEADRRSAVHHRRP